MAPTASLPKTADVVVIGSGYTGLLAALQTTRGGKTTVILEAAYLSEGCMKKLRQYSRQHIAPLEKAGKFPKRVMLGPNRVGWVDEDVLDWLQERLDRRETA